MLQSYMIKMLSKETAYFFAILVVLALLQHPDLLHSPLLRIENFIHNGSYLHPFLWSLGLYLIIGFFRVTLKFLIGLKNRYKK